MLTEMVQHRWEDFQKIFIQQSDLKISTTRLGSGVVLDSQQPHLVCLESQDPACSGIVLYSLKMGLTQLGRGSPDIIPDILVVGDDVEPVHCCLTHGERVVEKIYLSPGSIITLGQTAVFRFSDPRARTLPQKTKKSLASLNLSPIHKCSTPRSEEDNLIGLTGDIREAVQLLRSLTTENQLVSTPTSLSFSDSESGFTPRIYSSKSGTKSRSCSAWNLSFPNSEYSEESPSCTTPSSMPLSRSYSVDSSTFSLLTPAGTKGKIQIAVTDYALNGSGRWSHYEYQVFLAGLKRARYMTMATNNEDSTKEITDRLSDTKLKQIEDEVAASYVLVDIGANLTNSKYSRDLDSVIERAKDAGVRKIMVTGASIQCSKDALRLTRLYPGTLYSTAGVHPHDAKTWTDDCYDVIKELALNPECVAVGECGLDFNRNFSPPDVQLEVFEKQVQLACEIKKPMFLHERDAHDDLVRILEKYRDRLPPTVVHCFTGTSAQAQKYIEMGLYVGLTGFLWKDKSDDGVRAVLEKGLIPLDRLLVETDAPFMYPNVRGSKIPPHVKQGLTERSLSFLNRYCTFQRNEPCSLPVTVEMIAAYMKRTPDEVAMATTINAMKLFGLSS
nr:EOG090X080R [Eulimnadia texana]